MEVVSAARQDNNASIQNGKKQLLNGHALGSSKKALVAENFIHTRLPDALILK